MVAEGTRPYTVSPAAVAQRRDAAEGRVITGLYRSRNGLPKPVRQKLLRLVHDLYAELPWLRPSDYEAVRGFAHLIVLRDKIQAALYERGLFTGDGQVSRLTEELRRTQDSLLRYSVQLGLTPRARAELGLVAAEGKQAELAVDALLAKGTSE